MGSTHAFSIVLACVANLVFAANPIRQQKWMENAVREHVVNAPRAPIRKHFSSGKIAANGDVDMSDRFAYSEIALTSVREKMKDEIVEVDTRGEVKIADADVDKISARGNMKTLDKDVERSKHPNLVMVILDDFGWADVGYHNSSFPTPKQDQLAKEGIILEHYYVFCTCTPTRSALLTGRQPFNIGMQWFIPSTPGQDVKIPYDVPTIGERLRDAGYQTHYIGKWHVGAKYWNMTPTCRGFETFFGYHEGAVDFYDKGIINGFLDYDYWNQTSKNLDKVHSTDEQTKHGEDWADYPEQMYLEYDFREELKRIIGMSRAVLKPLFLIFAPMLLHDPLQLPPGGVPDVCSTITTRPAPFCQDNQTTGCYEAAIKPPCYAGNASCLDVTESRQTLCAMGHYLDGSIDLLVDELKDDWDNTLIWVSTDNGGKMLEEVGLEVGIGGKTKSISISHGSASSNWPLRGGKTNLFEGGVRGISWLTGGFIPQAARGTIFRGLLQHVDIPTTLAHLGGASLKDLDGYDVWEAVTSGLASPRTEVPLQIDISPLTRNLGSLHLVNKFSPGEFYVCESARHGGRGTCEQLALIKMIENKTWKLISGTPGIYHADIYFTNDGHHYGDYALIRPADGAQAAEFHAKRRFRNQQGVGQNHNVYLFDLDADPTEQNNLALTPEQRHKDIINEMLARLWEHYASSRNGYKHPQSNIKNLIEAASVKPDADGFLVPAGDPEECLGSS